jgi:anti-anti-sigma factor
MPVELDVSNAAAVREQLLLVLNQGASILIIDMTASTFCDCAGASAVVRAFRRASAAGARVRLVSGGPAIERIFGLLGIGRIIDVYPSLAAAIGAPEGPRCARHHGPQPPDRDQVSKGGG